jgi:hypothetical protein
MISSYFHLANMSNPPHATSDEMTPLQKTKGTHLLLSPHAAQSEM